MSRLERLVAAVRPGIELRALAVHDDEAVLAGGQEVFRLPLAPSAAVRHAVLVQALPALRTALPVAVAVPRYIGVMADGTTPFTAEPLLPGTVPLALSSIATGQLAGALAALAAVSTRQAQQWGVLGASHGAAGTSGASVLLHGDLRRSALLADPSSGLLTGIVGWRLRFGAADEDLASLEPELRLGLT